ncbi:MAG: AgmX/PglI C-terminal domain-containing protein [bacterium]
MSKRYYLPKIEKPFEFEEIAEKILKGELVKNDFIWFEGLENWIPVKDVSDFEPVFEVYRNEAEKHIAKALGEDEESRRNDEIRSVLSGNDDETIDFNADKNFVPEWITPGRVFVFFLMIAVFTGFFYFYRFIYVDSLEKYKKSAELTKEDKLELERIRMSSGVTSIDKVEGIKIKKISRSEEEKILAEAYRSLKEDEAEKKALRENKKSGDKKTENTVRGKKKTASLFDEVSREELSNFRKSLVSSVSGKRKEGSVKNRKSMHKSESEDMDSGNLSSDQISKVVKENYRYIRHCYNRALKKDMNLRGKLEVTLHILGNGKVAKVETKGRRFKGTDMEACVKRFIKQKWEFPPFEGAISTVTIPFVLSSN